MKKPRRTPRPSSAALTSAGETPPVKRAKKSSSLKIAVQIADENAEPPSRREIAAIVRRALGGGGEIAVRFAAADESARLNARYRGKSHPADVLAFCYQHEADYVCGDIVVCFALAAEQAAAAKISAQARCARLVAHGALHLGGHTHSGASDAKKMAAAEAAVLDALGWEGA
jgi:probable rRNA maturation factor